MLYLTAPQRNVIDTENFFRNTPISNVGGFMFFDKRVDFDILSHAINKVIENADALRVIVSDNGQTVEEYEYRPVEIVQIQGDVQTIADEWMQIPFDLNSKLYDFKIIQKENKDGFFMKLHHLISDAWSVSLILSKIFEYYDILNNKNEVEDTIPLYVDFINNEGEYYKTKQFAKDETFWKEKYKNKPTFVTLSSKQNDFDVKASREKFVIDKKHVKQMEEYCNKNKISLAILFEALVYVYAARTNNADDVTLCTIGINRSGIKEKKTIGMFNSILPMTLKMDWNETITDLCKRIAEEHYETFRHQKYPYSMIMDIIRKEHGQSKLYDIMVSYQNGHIETNGTHEIETHWSFNGCSELGFMMNISDTDNTGNLDINIDYRLESYTKEDVCNIYERLINIKDQIIADKNILFKDIEIVLPKEKKQILIGFNNTKVKYPNNKCVFKYLEEFAKKEPDKTALVFENESITFGEFNEKVNAFANFIMKNNNVRNSIIGVMLERSIDMMIAIYGILKAGCAYMPMDPHFPKDRIEFMLQDSKAPMIVTDTKWLEEISDVTKKVEINKFNYEDFDKKNVKSGATSKDVAYVIYTSGSTGKPKGAQIQHHSMINRIKWMHEKYPLLSNDVILQKTPYTFDVSVWELFWWSMYGGSLKILIPEGHKDPSEIIQAVYTGKVTHMHFVPSMLNAFLEYLNANKTLVSKLKTLKYVFASGEALQSEHVKKFYELLGENGTTLHNLYGPTECTVDVSYYDCEKENIPDSIPIGKPVDNTQLLILDKALKLLPIGVAGELHISGVLVGKGYINRDELTKEKFIDNNYYKVSKMYKTGDLAKWLPDGNIEYLGRIDNQVKIRGLRVELGDIETAILRYSSMTHCVVNVFELNGEKNLCGYFTASSKININDLKQELLKSLPDYMVPSYYVQMEKIPVNANGKADRKALPIPSIVDDEEYVAPKNEVEQKIQDVVQNVMKKNEVSVESDLLTLGLSSLGVITIMTELSSYGINIKVKDFYNNRTISSLAKSVERIESNVDDYSDDENYRDISDIRIVSLPHKEKTGVLLTGATGFLGIHILDELIKTTDRNIYCLIRNKEKFERFLEKYTEIKKDEKRIIPIIGDIIEENLGVSEEKYKELLENVSDVIHSAASVSFFCAWEKSKKINYDGTCKILKFAEESNSKLHHISTMSVSGDILTAQTENYPDFTEDKLYIGQLYQDNVYAHSKYLAEKEIIKAIRNRKVNASIYRLPNLTWRMSDGAFQENFYENDLYILTNVMRKVGKMPEELANENILLTPVDDLARAIVLLINNRMGNDVYNLVSSSSPTVLEYINTLTSIKLEPMLDLYNEIKNNHTDEQMQFVSMYLSGVLNNTKNMIVNVQSKETNAILLDMGYNWGKIDKKYIMYIDDIK